MYAHVQVVPNKTTTTHTHTSLKNNTSKISAEGKWKMFSPWWMAARWPPHPASSTIEWGEHEFSCSCKHNQCFSCSHEWLHNGHLICRINNWTGEHEFSCSCKHNHSSFGNQTTIKHAVNCFSAVHFYSSSIALASIASMHVAWGSLLMSLETCKSQKRNQEALTWTVQPYSIQPFFLPKMFQTF